MSNEPPGGDDSTSTSFEAWLDQQAESQGMTREELFEQLVSSYWTLNEMTQLLDDSGGANAPIRRGREPQENESRAPDGDPPSSTNPNENPDRRRNDRPAEDRGSGTRPRPDAAPAVSHLEDRIDDLEEQLEEVQADLESEAEHGQTLDQLFDALADRLTEVESEVDEVATAAESTETTLTERIEALESDLTERQAALEDEHEEVEEWLNAEFDSLRTILEYLIDRTDELERDIATAGSQQERELERLRAEREALQSIKRDAADHDAHDGQCESCDETIDLDLLTRPYCPNCDAPLAGVETENRFWFFTDTVVTTHDTGGDRDLSTSTSEERSAPRQRREREQKQGQKRGRMTDQRADIPPESNAGLETPPEVDQTTAGQSSESRMAPESSGSSGTGRSPERDQEEKRTDGRSESRHGRAEESPESIDLETPFSGKPESTGGREGSGSDERGETDQQANPADSTVQEESTDGESGFEFGGATDLTGSDSPSNKSRKDSEPKQSDSPFGDLEDLRREEEGTEQK